jgi:dTDP-glucose 4,6-dehydratase
VSVVTYLVLGSNSFSGGSFIDYLLSNTDAKVIAVSRSEENNKALLAYKSNLKIERVEFHKLDLNKNIQEIISLIYEHRVEYIVNFAAQGMVSQSWTNPEEWFRTNTLSLVSLIDKIYKFSFIKKFIQASTPEVYGCCDNVKESMNFAPSSPYAASKAAADLILYSYFKTHSFPINYTRSSNVYGPYQQLYRIIPKTILSIKKDVKIQLQGAGKAVRSFIHIDDVSKSTLAICNSAKSGEIYHLTGDKVISIYDLVKIIGDELRVDIDNCIDITEDRVAQDAHYFMDNKKLFHDFNLKPGVKLREGIRDTILWIESNYDDLITYPDYYVHKK